MKRVNPAILMLIHAFYNDDYSPALTRQRSAMKYLIINVTMSLLLVACRSGGGGDTAIPHDNSSTLGVTFATYKELSEANNNSRSVSEITGYTLDADGIKIDGVFEANNVSQDYYRFNTGALQTVDVYVFIDGVRQDNDNARVGLTLDNYVDDGYGALFGYYFSNAHISPTGASNQDWVIGVSEKPGGNVAGSHYTLEIHHKN